MTPDQLEVYGLPESFADYSLIVRSDRETASPGTEGNDVIESVVHSDLFSGGGGADVFTYGLEPDDFTCCDIIMDFSRDEGDKIDLSRIDADTTQPGNQALTFSGQTPAANSVWYVLGVNLPGSIHIYADVDGSPELKDFYLTLYSGPHMQESDFFL